QGSAADDHADRDDLLCYGKIAERCHGVLALCFGFAISASLNSLELTRSATWSAASGLISNRTRCAISVKRIMPPLLMNSSESPTVSTGMFPTALMMSASRL